MSWELIQGLEGLDQGFEGLRVLGIDSGSRVLGIDSGFRLLQVSWGFIQGLQVLRGLAISLEQLCGLWGFEFRCLTSNQQKWNSGAGYGPELISGRV